MSPLIDICIRVLRISLDVFFFSFLNKLKIYQHRLMQLDLVCYVMPAGTFVMAQEAEHQILKPEGCEFETIFPLFY